VLAEVFQRIAKCDNFPPTTMARPNVIGKFRPPSLRNVAVRAPCMHDGSLKSLKAVLDRYTLRSGSSRKARMQDSRC